jgi:thiamine pyrophosphate-dependent acetolactate synthase large subunit-like protein
MLGRKTGCLLIVMVDADKETVVQREKELCESLDKAGEKAIKPGEPVVILIPKWQVETWIKSALGQTLSEDDSTTDHPRVQSLDIKKAAETIYEWARPNAKVGKSCVESLRVALPRWAATDSPQ